MNCFCHSPAYLLHVLLLRIGSTFILAELDLEFSCGKFKMADQCEATDGELRICSCLSCVYRGMDTHEKFGENERFVRVARGAAENNSSFLSALQTSQVHP